MTALILDKDTLKMLTAAYSITAYQSGDRHSFVIYPKAGNYFHKIDLPLEGAIRGSKIDKEEIYSTTSSASLDYSELDVFKFLKVGDEIRLEWYPDTTSPYLENLGMVCQKLNLVIWRKAGKGLNCLKLHLSDGVYSRSDTYSQMCQGFKLKVREVA